MKLPATTLQMKRLHAYTLHLTNLLGMGVCERLEANEAGDITSRLRKLTLNDRALLEHERRRWQGVIYRWQKKSGERITGIPLGKRKARTCRPCEFDVKAYAKEMRA